MELVQAVCLKPALQLLEGNGVKVHEYLDKSGLSFFSPRNPKSWLPKPLVFDFIRLLDKKEFSSSPIDDLEPAYRLENMAHYGDYLLSSRNMFQAAMRATGCRARILTYHTVEVTTGGFYPAIKSQYNHRSDRVEQIIEGCSLLLMLDGLSKFGGEECKLKFLDITLDDLPTTTLSFDLSGTRIRLGQKAHIAGFPQSWLFRRSSAGTKQSNSPRLAPSSRYSDRLLAIFGSMEPGIRPSMKGISRVTRISSRSIQRKLESEGTTFSSLVDEWVMQNAISRLKESSDTISQISADLGYSEPSHFVRAFMRLVGTSPSTYRGTVAQKT